MSKTNSFIGNQESLERLSLSKKVCEMYFIHSLSVCEIASKTCSTRSLIYRIIRTFALEHPEIKEQMKKTGNTITPKDYKDLKAEITKLQTELRKEKLRAGHNHPSLSTTFTEPWKLHTHFVPTLMSLCSHPH